MPNNSKGVNFITHLTLLRTLLKPKKRRKASLQNGKNFKKFEVNLKICIKKDILQTGHPPILQKSIQKVISRIFE